MKHSLENDRKYLIWNNQRGIAHVISRDYRWFMDRYLPAVIRLEKAGFKKDRFLLSDCYYMIGDINDFNKCPKAAIKAYQKSFKIDTTHSEALREMGDMYERMGKYKKAASLLKESLRINPHDECAISDYECAIESGGHALYDEKDTCWKAREFLAADRPNSALKLLAKKRSIAALQIKACAYGILNNTEAFLEQWHKIAKSKKNIEMGYVDWFYMTDSIWNSEPFWKIFASCAKENRFIYGVWSTFDSLYDAIVPLKTNGNRKCKADIRRCNRRIFLLTQYHIAQINCDYKLAEKLFRKYPKFKEVAQLCKKLSR